MTTTVADDPKVDAQIELCLHKTESDWSSFSFEFDEEGVDIGSILYHMLDVFFSLAGHLVTNSHICPTNSYAA